MKKLIYKILKESEDEFDWVHGIGTADAEKDIQRYFRAAENDWGFDGPKIYDMIVKAGVRDIFILKDIGSEIYDEAERVFDQGRDRGRDDCNCDGCCDDYVWYEDHRQNVRDAREEGEEQGYERGVEDGLKDGRDESRNEIEELKARIIELESQLNETVNKKNIKRI